MAEYNYTEFDKAHLQYYRKANPASRDLSDAELKKTTSYKADRKVWTDEIGRLKANDFGSKWHTHVMRDSTEKAVESVIGTLNERIRIYDQREVDVTSALEDKYNKAVIRVASLDNDAVPDSGYLRSYEQQLAQRIAEKDAKNPEFRGAYNRNAVLKELTQELTEDANKKSAPGYAQERRTQKELEGKRTDTYQAAFENAARQLAAAEGVTGDDAALRAYVSNVSDTELVPKIIELNAKHPGSTGGAFNYNAALQEVTESLQAKAASLAQQKAERQALDRSFQPSNVPPVDGISTSSMSPAQKLDSFLQTARFASGIKRNPEATFGPNIVAEWVGMLKSTPDTTTFDATKAQLLEAAAAMPDTMRAGFEFQINGVQRTPQFPIPVPPIASSDTLLPIDAAPAAPVPPVMPPVTLDVMPAPVAPAGAAPVVPEAPAPAAPVPPVMPPVAPAGAAPVVPEAPAPAAPVPPVMPPVALDVMPAPVAPAGAAPVVPEAPAPAAPVPPVMPPVAPAGAAPVVPETPAPVAPAIPPAAPDVMPAPVAPAGAAPVVPEAPAPAAPVPPVMPPVAPAGAAPVVPETPAPVPPVMPPAGPAMPPEAPITPQARMNALNQVVAKTLADELEKKPGDHYIERADISILRIRANSRLEELPQTDKLKMLRTQLETERKEVESRYTGQDGDEPRRQMETRHVRLIMDALANDPAFAGNPDKVLDLQRELSNRTYSNRGDLKGLTREAALEKLVLEAAKSPATKLPPIPDVPTTVAQQPPQQQVTPPQQQPQPPAGPAKPPEGPVKPPEAPAKPPVTEYTSLSDYAIKGAKPGNLAYYNNDYYNDKARPGVMTSRSVMKDALQSHADGITIPAAVKDYLADLSNNGNNLSIRTSGDFIVNFDQATKVSKNRDITVTAPDKKEPAGDLVVKMTREQMDKARFEYKDGKTTITSAEGRAITSSGKVIIAVVDEKRKNEQGDALVIGTISTEQLVQKLDQKASSLGALLRKEDKTMPVTDTNGKAAGPTVVAAKGPAQTGLGVV